jgi:carboxypeptidase-like protein
MMNFKILFTVLFFAVQIGIAQEEELKELQVIGTVTDSENKPIKGVLVYVDSVKTGVKTNKMGYFTLKLNSGTKLISFFSPDYGINDINYTSQNRINFAFMENPKRISKKSLAALGYKNTNRKTKRSAASNDDVVYTDIYQMIVAKVPGTQVVGNKVRLRGNAISSVNSGIEPLFIVDGTTTSSIDFINPMDVKSIRALKDESASFYGTRGASGVIIIVLKK